MSKDATFALYRMYNAADDLLYVGITSNPGTRIKNHRDQKAWWSEVEKLTVEHFGSRKELAAAERRAVRDENPRYNVVRFTGHAQPRSAPESLRPK